MLVLLWITRVIRVERMKIGEISLDSSISISVRRGAGSVNLKAVPLGVWGDALYVQPIMFKKSMLSFDAKDLIIRMLAIRENMVPYYWRSVIITKERFEGKVCHCIRSKSPGVKLNRRSSSRVNLGVFGEIDYMNLSRVRVTIKDISATGISFQIPSSSSQMKFRVGDQARVYFVDNEYHFNVDADIRIVRRLEQNYSTVYGCKYMKVYPNIDSYVEAKQSNNHSREMLIKMHGR